METPRKIPDTPQRNFEIKDPKLPVIHGTAPHNRREEHQNPRPTQQIQIQ